MKLYKNRSSFDLIIVGSGIAGSSVYYAAYAAGLNPVIISESDENASRAALAVINRGFFSRSKHRETFQALTDESIDLYDEWGLVHNPGPAQVRLFWSSRQRRGKMISVDPEKALVKPHVKERVAAVYADDFARVTLANGRDLVARRGVVVCVGSPMLGGPAASHYDYAVSGIVEALQEETVIHAYRSAPYTDYYRVDYKTHARVGVTFGHSANMARNLLTHEVAGLIRRGEAVTDYRVGQRYYGGGDGPIEMPAGSGIWYITGLGRYGYSLAPAYAQYVVAQIKRRR